MGEQVRRLLKLSGCFRREADNDIGAQSYTRYFSAYLSYQPLVLFCRVAPLHCLEDVIAACLYRKAYVFTDFVQGGNSPDELEAHIFGVIGQEAYSRQSFYIV